LQRRTNDESPKSSTGETPAARKRTMMETPAVKPGKGDTKKGSDPNTGLFRRFFGGDK
jgi:hypothetical protein